MKINMKIKKLATILALVISLIFPSSALADSLGPDPAGVKQLQQIILRVINLIVPLAFMAVLAMLVWGGIKYLTSAGDPQDIKKASSTITQALLGILFLALAWVILKLVAAFTGVQSLTTFCLGFPGSTNNCP